MALSISQKLKIKEGFALLTLHAPAGFEKALSPLPKNVSISTSKKNYDQVHWFVQNKAQLEKELNKILKLIKPGIVFWIYFPKGTSKIQTDLTRDKGWESLLAYEDKLTWLSLISFDKTWSAFGFRAKNEADKKKERNKNRNE